MDHQSRRPSQRLRRWWSFSSLGSLVLVVCSLFWAQVALAGGVAPNGPGSSSIWTPSNNTILGTAANTTSQVWFTGYNGVIGEVFFPTADTPNSTDFQFLVGNSTHSWVDEEKVATTSSVVLYDSHSLAWTVTNTATSGKYKIQKTIYTDPSRNSLIQDVTFTALTGHLSDSALHPLQPHHPQRRQYQHQFHPDRWRAHRAGLTDSTGNYASALAASIPYVSGMTSSGFVGQNDGWTDLKGTSNCGSGTCPDYTMNYTYSSATNGNTAQTGQLDLTNGGTINTTTATTETFELVPGLWADNGTSATTGAEATLNGTLGDATNMLSTYVSQWHTFDNGLNTPPAVAQHGDSAGAPARILPGGEYAEGQPG